MLQKFMVVGKIPEIRSEPKEAEADTHEVELYLPIDAFIEAQEIIDEIRFADQAGISSEQHFRRLKHLLKGYIVYERDRIWFIRTF